MKKKSFNTKLLLNKKVISELHQRNTKGGTGSGGSNFTDTPDCELTIDFYMCGESILNICEKIIQ